MYIIQLGMIAIHRSEKLRPIKWLQISVFVLTVLICMSTVFLKQHSILDVFGGIILSVIMYTLVYLLPDNKAAKEVKQELSNI